MNLLFVIFVTLLFVWRFFILVIAPSHTHKFSVTYRNNTFEVTYRPYIIDDAIDEDYPEQCYHLETKNAWPVGVNYRWSGECKAYFCSRAGTIVVRDCGKVKIPNGCKLAGQNLKKPQPYCCPKYLCNDTLGEEFLFNPLAPIDW